MRTYDEWVESVKKIEYLNYIWGYDYERLWLWSYDYGRLANMLNAKFLFEF